MGAVRVNGSTSGYVELAAPAVAGSVVMTLPATTGTLATTADTAAAGGMVLITPTSVAGTGVTLSGGAVNFAAASTMSLNGVFSALYDNYVMYITGVGSGSNYLQTRLRVAGVDASGGSDYLMNYTTNGVYGADAAGSLWIRLIAFETTNPNSSVVTFLKPFLATPTGVQFTSRNPIPWTVSGGGAHLPATSYDGLTIILGGGSNATGTLRVYGLRNS